ncbi:MAG TPA: NUDIX domain-containing protein [Thermoleophilaceae bacterium]|nr:NUDIX domain-containing protein [Thermoleophilaceae bacterium]
MRVDGPPPGEELNPGQATEPRAAASVILLRDTAPGLQVLLVKRNPKASFMGGAWVFPGGAVQEADGGPEGAALRELEEEAAISLGGAGELVPFSRWVTPVEVTVRFDTCFYLARAPAGAEAACDGQECVEARWLEPAAALAAGRTGELFLVFPTVKHLEQLARLESVEEALATARGRSVEPVLPRVVERDGAAHVLLPGEPGYDGPS